MPNLPSTPHFLDDVRRRAIALLTEEGRAVHSGEIALRLQVKTSEVYAALHHPHQTGKLYYTASEGWSLPQEPERLADDCQERLA